MMMTQITHSRVKMAQGTTTFTFPSSSSVRQLARITHSMEIRVAAWREGEKESYSYLSTYRSQFISRLLHDLLTNNSSGDIDNVPRGVRWDLSTWAEEQLDCEGLSDWPLLHLCAILVATVPSVHGHLLPFHHLHQLLCLAGRIQGPWLVPVNGGKCIRNVKILHLTSPEKR